MSTTQLGRLQKVDLRKAWSSESGDFTPWLAQEENLELLGATIEINLEFESQEKSVGPFRADILCKDTETDDWVLIENQLERTDHSHLGQLLTYAAGLKAVTIVWIAERFTEEHRAALDWLNERTDKSINLFGLEVEVWRIGESLMAPKFNIISKPNDWSRTVKQAAVRCGDISYIDQLRLKFLTDFKQYMENSKSLIRFGKPNTRKYSMNSESMKRGAYFNPAVLGDGTIRAGFYLKGPTAKQDYTSLEKRKETIEKELGFELRWHNKADNSCRLDISKDADFQNEELWTEQFEWLKSRLEAMHRVFLPIMKEIKAGLLEDDI